MTGIKEKPNCYKCIYRGALPGSAHSCCKHPAVQSVAKYPLMQIIGLLGKRSGITLDINDVDDPLGVTAIDHGIQQGWFLYPVNFDPAWLLTCKGYTTEIVKEEV